MIELLTVVAILGVLAAILLPTIGKARAQAHATRCASNLRQIGLAMHLYIADNKGCFPWGVESDPETGQPSKQVWQILRPLMAGGSRQTTPMEAWNCPKRGMMVREDSVQPSTYTISYSANPHLMDNQANATRNQVPLPLTAVKRPTETIAFIDANQRTPSALSFAVLFGPAFSNVSNPARADDPVTQVPFVAPSAAAELVDASISYVRYSHDGSALAVFVDGHVGRFARGSIRYRNLEVRY